MIVSVGSAYTDTVTGRQVEVLALTPRVLYSPKGTYDDDFSDARIFQIDLEDFLLRFIDIIDDLIPPLNFIFLVDSDGAILTDGPGGPLLIEAV